MTSAKIIAITKPLIQLDDPSATSLKKSMSPEEFMAFCARVSNPGNQMNHETSGRLLRYCLEHGHWSVFEQVDVTMELKTNRAIMAQVLRHHSARFQEFSQRYAEVQGFDFTDIEIHEKHAGGNRQGSGEANDELTGIAHDGMMEAVGFYQTLLERNASPETARFNLPLGTPTTAYMKASVRTWITYFWQRRDAHAQGLHRKLADLAFEEFRGHFPLISEIAEAGKSRYITHADWELLQEAKRSIKTVL